MARAFLIVMDSVGCGGAPDAADFGDAGANTLGHIAAECAAGRADIGRQGPLRMPHLDALGLGAAIKLASGQTAAGFSATPKGRWGAATEVSRGKDTPSGHWELAGVPVPWDWTYFPDTSPAFPPDLVELVCKLAGTQGDFGQLPRLWHADHRAAFCRASALGLADLLYLGRQRVPDCGA